MQSTLSLLQTKRNLHKLSQFSLESDSDSEESGSDFLDVVISMFSRNIWTGKQILHQKLVESSQKSNIADVSKKCLCQS